jgi:hypothetical protein
MVSAPWNPYLSSCSTLLRGTDHSRETLDAKLVFVRASPFAIERGPSSGSRDVPQQGPERDLCSERERTPLKGPRLASGRSVSRRLQVQQVSLPAVSFPFTDPIPPALEARRLYGFDRAADRLHGDRAATVAKEKNRRTCLHGMRLMQITSQRLAKGGGSRVEIDM